jgi:predicted ATPase
LRQGRARGAAILAGRAFEEERSLAYGPIVEALRARLREAASWTATVPPRALAETARLLPELADPAPLLEEPGAQTRFSRGCGPRSRPAAAGSSPGILMLDDAQWADEATLGLLAYGVRRLEKHPLLVLLTWRTPHEHPLRSVVADAERDGLGAVLPLRRLGAEETDALVRAARPGTAAGLARQLHAVTEGLPFLLTEYLRAPAGDAEWRLPAGARELLRSRLASVSETGRQVLSAAAVIGRSFDSETVRVTSGRGEEETVDALEELSGRGLVREGAVDYDFGHEQLRRLVYDDTSLARRRLLHGAQRTPAAARLRSGLATCGSLVATPKPQPPMWKPRSTHARCSPLPRRSSTSGRRSPSDIPAWPVST